MKHLAGFVALLASIALTGCASKFNGVDAGRFDDGSRLFDSVTLTQTEKKEIVSAFNEAGHQDSFIYEVYSEAPNKIQILTLDRCRMEYGTGRIYHFKKTDSGWLLDLKADVDSWASV